MFQKLFNPKAVAIIGASQKELSIGNVITKNLIKYNYQGPVYPINPKADEIRGVKAYPSILEVPGEVDLAHLSIPAKFAPMAVKECGEKGVKFIIINSAGFKEVGEEGEKLEQAVIATAKEYGIRIFGPNCQGVINTDPAIKAYCNFTFTYPEPGYVSIVAQSGGVGALFMQSVHDLGIGMRLYASNGNACDISIPEILKYYGDDELTRVIILYVEGFADPREFMQAAQEVALKKPVLAMRAGRTREGAKAAVSHTGGLVSVGQSIELIFKKTGILFFEDQEELCQAAMAFSMQPIPGGNRVGMITDTGGPAIIATDQLVNSGLEIPPLSEKAKEILKEKLYPDASINNPVDVLATAAAHHYRAAMDVLLAEENIDSIYLTFVTPPFVDTKSCAEEMVKVSKLRKKPLICNYMTDKPQFTATTQVLKKGEIPCYDFPEMAAKALAALTGYQRVRSRGKGKIPRYNDIDKNRVKNILKSTGSADNNILSAEQVYGILSSYGIPVAAWAIVKNPAEAEKAAARIGYPVVIKADSREIIHKSDVGGVALNLQDSKAVKKALERMQNDFSVSDLTFFMQKYLPGGIEVITGAVIEPGLGHTIMFGMGGVLVELLKDVAFELSPVNDLEAAEMVSSLKSYPIIEGYRGKEGANREKLVELILRVSQLVTDFSEIKELDLNPIMAFKDKVMVVDARILI